MNEREWIQSLPRSPATDTPVDVASAVLQRLRSKRVAVPSSREMLAAAALSTIVAVAMACVAGVELWNALNSDPLAGWLGGWTLEIR